MSMIVDGDNNCNPHIGDNLTLSRSSITCNFCHYMQKQQLVDEDITPVIYQALSLSLKSGSSNKSIRINNLTLFEFKVFCQHH